MWSQRCTRGVGRFGVNPDPLRKRGGGVTSSLTMIVTVGQIYMFNRPFS